MLKGQLGIVIKELRFVKGLNLNLVDWKFYFVQRWFL